MLFNHTPTSLSHTVDDERLIADAGLIPLMKLAQDTGLPRAVAGQVHIYKLIYRFSRACVPS